MFCTEQHNGRSAAVCAENRIEDAGDRNLTIVYASDKNYAALTAISAVSALKHNPGVHIVLLGYNLETEAQDLVRSRVERHGGTFAYCDVSLSIAKLVEKGYSGYTSYAAYARIFIPEILQCDGRVLYIDGDTLVNGSFSELMQMDMQGRPFALSVDCVPFSFKKAINVPDDVPYFNSGVMLMDLKVWREKRCTERFLDELANPKGPNPLGDQDIFVRVFPGEIALMHPKWNFISHFFLFSYKGLARIVGGEKLLLFTPEAYREAHRDPRVYHFLGHTLGRPWYTSSMHPMRKRYQEAAQEAELPEVAEQERPMFREYVVQYYLHRFLPQPVFDWICHWLYRINIRRNYHV